MGSNFNNPVGQALNSQMDSNFNNPVGQALNSQMGPNFNNPVGQALNSQMGPNFNNPVGQALNSQMGPNFNNPLGSAMNNQMGFAMSNPIGQGMSNPIGAVINNPMGPPLANQQIHYNLPNNIGPTAQVRMPGQIYNQPQGFYNPNAGFHQFNPIRKQKEPATFDGKTTDWVDYIIQFEKVANWNGWDQYERAQQLIMCLRGIAQRTVSELNPYQLNDFEFIKRMLSQRFNPIERETAHKFEFKNRRKQKDESVSDYGHALRRLASQAYPTLNLASTEALVVDQFVEGIGNRDLKRYVQLLNRPKTLDQAISFAIEYEAFEGPVENVRKPQFSDEVTYHTYVVDQSKHAKQAENLNLEEKIKNILIQELKNENTKSTVNETVRKNLDENTHVKPVNENLKRRSVITCDYCGKKGHIQTRCFKKNEDELTRMREELAKTKTSEQGE